MITTWLGATAMLLYGTSTLALAAFALWLWKWARQNGLRLPGVAWFAAIGLMLHPWLLLGNLALLRQAVEASPPLKAMASSLGGRGTGTSASAMVTWWNWGQLAHGLATALATLLLLSEAAFVLASRGHKPPARRLLLTVRAASPVLGVAAVCCAVVYHLLYGIGQIGW